MATLTIAQVRADNNTRQLLSYTSDPVKRQIQRRASVLLAAACDFDTRTALLIDHLYAQGDSASRAEADRLVEESRAKHRRSAAAARRFLAYVTAHPLESY